MDIERLQAHMNNGKPEYIMCAANYYDDGEDYLYQPYNIDKGFVVCGWRHACCGSTYLATNKDVVRWDNCVQGFLTTKNRFLNRHDALLLVMLNGQLTKPTIGGELTSEDLW